MRSLLGSGSPLLLLALSLAACGGSPPPPPAPPAENAQAFSLEAERTNARSLVERVCACDDQACVDSVVAELDAVVMTFGEATRAQGEIDACHVSPGRRIAETAIQELEVLRQDACVCMDSTCASGIQARFGEFMERHKSSQGSEEQAERAGEIAEQMMECLVKAQGNATTP